jgi:hypothetical protein
MRAKLLNKAILIGLTFFVIAGAKAQTLFEVKSLPFNSKNNNEFGALAYNDGLVLVTYRVQHLYKTEVDVDEKDINDLYFVQKLDSAKWGELQFFSTELNTKNHEGKATFTKDGNTIYFTRFLNPEGNIIKAVKSGGEWKSQVVISLNSTEYRIKDPSLSTDGKKLFFASNASDGFGGYDIYVSTFERGDWSKPKNLGPLVNTSGNEVAPFIHASGKLYFSSNKLPGLGKYDIFYTREVNGKWITPKNLPEPVNSTRDDMYYFSDPGDSTGYFSTNRNRSFDIYSFRSLWPSFGECKPVEKNSYSYRFTEDGVIDENDSTTSAWLYEWDFGDGSPKVRTPTSEAVHTFPGTGQYLVQINVIDTLTGVVMLNANSYPFEALDVEQAVISCNDEIGVSIPARFDAASSNLPEFKKIDYYFWDFGDRETATGIAPEHTYHSPGKYTVKLCIQAAPDETEVVKKTCVFKEIMVTTNQ